MRACARAPPHCARPATDARCVRPTSPQAHWNPVAPMDRRIWGCRRQNES
jgi:hypothetical protein